MEFVLHPTLPSQIILGPRVAAGVGDLDNQSQVQQVLVAIVKGTFQADDPSATPLPVDQQLPLLLQDQFFDPNGEQMRYEHDLAIFKPRTDIVVLGTPAPPPAPPGGIGPLGNTWTERVSLNGAVMEDNFSFPIAQPFTFGWQSRTNGARGPRDPENAPVGYAGFFGEDGTAFDPETMQLPRRFNNLFFNGGLYQDGIQPVFVHPPASATVVVRTTASYQVGPNIVVQTQTRELDLPALGPQAVITYRAGSAPDSPTVNQSLDMNSDTIVYDKDTNQFYAVWRGVWDYASVPADRYVSLVLS